MCNAYLECERDIAETYKVSKIVIYKYQTDPPITVFMAAAGIPRNTSNNYRIALSIESH